MRAVLRATVQVAPSAVIGECCVLGCVKEARLRGAGADLEKCAREAADVVIGERCLLFNQVVIYEGCRLGDGCVVEDRVRIGYDTWVGMTPACNMAPSFTTACSPLTVRDRQSWQVASLGRPWGDQGTSDERGPS